MCTYLSKFPVSDSGRKQVGPCLHKLSAFYDVPNKLPPFEMSDHDTVEDQPLARQAYPRCKLVLKSRALRMTISA
jgi:hypothetical protein